MSDDPDSDHWMLCQPAFRVRFCDPHPGTCARHPHHSQPKIPRPRSVDINNAHDSWQPRRNAGATHPAECRHTSVRRHAWTIPGGGSYNRKPAVWSTWPSAEGGCRQPMHHGNPVFDETPTVNQWQLTSRSRGLCCSLRSRHSWAQSSSDPVKARKRIARSVQHFFPACGGLSLKCDSADPGGAVLFQVVSCGGVGGGSRAARQAEQGGVVWVGAPGPDAMVHQDASSPHRLGAILGPIDGRACARASLSHTRTRMRKARVVETPIYHLRDTARGTQGKHERAARSPWAVAAVAWLAVAGRSLKAASTGALEDAASPTLITLTRPSPPMFTA